MPVVISDFFSSWRYRSHSCCLHPTCLKQLPPLWSRPPAFQPRLQLWNLRFIHCSGLAGELLAQLNWTIVLQPSRQPTPKQFSFTRATSNGNPSFSLSKSNSFRLRRSSSPSSAAFSPSKKSTLDSSSNLWFSFEAENWIGVDEIWLLTAETAA